MQDSGRRDFLKASVVSLAAGGLGSSVLAGPAGIPTRALEGGPL